MTSKLTRAFPWCLAAILSVAVWRDHSHTLVPWLLTVAMAFAYGRLGRRPSRRTSPITRILRSAVVLPEPRLSSRQRAAQHAVMQSLDRQAFVIGR